METQSQPRTMPWGHFALLAGIAAFTLWYWQDARRASSDIQNLLLIQPAAILALALCAMIVIGALRQRADETHATESGSWRSRHGRGIAVALLLAAYVVALVPVGFDVATFVFLAAAMYALGERRTLFLAGYSALLSGFLSYGFKVMLSVPVPTLLF